MLVSVEEVQALTKHTTDEDTIQMAQWVIEAYVGRSEGDPMTSSDELILSKAVAYQAVYMHGSESKLFTTAAATYVSQGGNAVSYGDELSLYIAPLAKIACKNLSWKRMRSVKTGGVFDDGVKPLRWEED
jgi:hypothetical protein